MVKPYLLLDITASAGASWRHVAQEPRQNRFKAENYRSAIIMAEP